MNNFFDRDSLVYVGSLAILIIIAVVTTRNPGPEDIIKDEHGVYGIYGTPEELYIPKLTRFGKIKDRTSYVYFTFHNHKLVANSPKCYLINFTSTYDKLYPLERNFSYNLNAITNAPKNECEKVKIGG